MQDIQDRFRSVIRYNTSDTRRYAEMEALTGIPAASWNKAFNRKQRPTPEMIQAVAQLWPEFAFWLATGVTDARHGHISCRDGLRRQFYPERTFARRGSAGLYFSHLIEMFRRKYGDKEQYPTELLEREAETELLRLEIARKGEEHALEPADASIDALRAAEQTERSVKDREKEEGMEPARRIQLNDPAT